MHKQRISLTLFAVLVIVALGAAQCVQVETQVVVTKEVEVEKEVVKEVVVTPTPAPGRQTLIVGLSQAPTSLDPADHRSRLS